MLERTQELIEMFPYKTTKLDGLLPLSQFGLDGSYGGRAKGLAKVKDTSYYIVFDESLETIDVLEEKQEETIEIEELPEELPEELQEETSAEEKRITRRKTR